MADDAPTRRPISSRRSTAEDAQPEKLRVHSLARVLGTTSKRVLDALTELDGRPRSAQSAVERRRSRARCAKRCAEPVPDESAGGRPRSGRPTPAPTGTSRSPG